MMQAYVNKTACQSSVALVLLTEDDLTAWLANGSEAVRQWVQDNGFLGKAQTFLLYAQCAWTSWASPHRGDILR